jgi:MtfA peptidase
VFGLFKFFRRRSLRRQTFPAAARRTIEKNCAWFGRLSQADRKALEAHAAVFLAEKKFEGCGGLKLNDEIRTTIAAHACLLLLHRNDDYYPELESILVYPTSYLAKTQEAGPAGTIAEYKEARLGESWRHGTVVLSWEDVQDTGDGRNVVLHEFAHQLDLANEEMDGAPELGAKQDYADWARIMKREYERLRRDDESGKPTVIDPYGAEEPAEFFAVITEAFFEAPAALIKEHPELYEQLRKFYRQDPVSWK